MTAMYPMWQLAEFTGEEDNGDFNNAPIGYAPAGLSKTAYAFSGGRYYYDETTKSFYMDPNWFPNRSYFNNEFLYQSGDYQNYGPKGLICLSDYITGGFTYMAIYLKANMDGRYIDNTQPAYRTNGNWGGDDAYLLPMSTWEEMRLRANIFNPSAGFRALEVPYNQAFDTNEKTFGELYASAAQTYHINPPPDPGEETPEDFADYGSVGYRLRIGAQGSGEPVIADASLGLGVQIVPDADDFYPNLEIIGLQIDNILLGVDHNGEYPGFWQDFHKSVERDT